MIRVCVVTTSTADYGRILPLIKEIQRRDILELQVVLGTSVYVDHLLWYLRHGNPASVLKSLPWYIRARLRTIATGNKGLGRVEHLAELLRKDNVPITARIPMHLEGDDHATMLRVAGFALLGATRVFEQLKPDIVVLHGDRAELLTIATAATMLHIPIAHIEGGDVSGTVDEHIRHAISKLSHLHFPITSKSAERLIRMGERPEYVIPTGMLALDSILATDLKLDNMFYDRLRPGQGRIDLTKPFLFITYHPVTSRAHEAYAEVNCLIDALKAISLPKFILAPNRDAGGRAMRDALRDYALSDSNAAFFKTVPVDDFYRLLNNASVAVGNSSSFVRESAFLGTPVVLVGDRQNKRERVGNVVEVSCEVKEIRHAIEMQLTHGRYEKSTHFGTGDAAKKIVDSLARLNTSLHFQKFFND